MSKVIFVTSNNERPVGS